MSVGERIKQRRLELGFSADYVAKRLEKNRATVYRYESDEIENMSLDIIAKLAEILSVDPAFLMGWSNVKENLNLESKYNYYPEPISAGIPLDMEAVINVNQISLPDFVMDEWAGDSEIFISRVNGESMNNVIPDKSLIAVKPVELAELKNNDIVVFSDDNEYSIKRFFHDKTNKRFIFRPDSNDRSFIDYTVPYENSNNLKIHGKVVLYFVKPY